MSKMYYSTPSSEWMEGFPIGNGRIAAMVWGDDKTDVLTLNHEWLWRGIHRDRKVTPANQYLGYVRELLKNKDFFKASVAANLFFAGDGGISSIKNRVDAYQTAGTLEFKLIDFNKFNYRELDINTGIALASRNNYEGGEVFSEFFTDSNDGILMARWYSEYKFSCECKIDRISDAGARYNYNVKQDSIVFECNIIGGIKYKIIVNFDTDGECFVNGNSVSVVNAAFVKCAVNIVLSDGAMNAELDKFPSAKFVLDNFEDIKLKHAEYFSREMNKVYLKLEEDGSLDNLTVTERLARIKEGKRDNGIVALYFNFGRYLMISSSICGNLPANLQGKWNDAIDPPWESDYHHDINLQMNYWMTEPCDMPQCSDALFKFLEKFYESGEEAAKALYGCRGIYLPIQTDAWGISTPEAFGWAVWIGAAPWLAQHFWKHFIYTGDIEFLKNRGYKFFKKVAEFYEDYLIKDENGIYQIMPSQSPENNFKEACGYYSMPVGICVSSAMDVQLAYDALTYAIKTAEILKTDIEQVAVWKNLRDNLPDFKIGTDGRLLEWDEEKTELQGELGHRHLSHLYGVYPSDLFTAESRVPQYEAARKSLEFRLEHGGGHTGWSRAWVACLQARFGNAKGFYEHFIALIRDFATITLLDLHPPRIFQIDGNLGAVAALIEAVISYTDGKVRLLRSVPAEWESGCLKGIKVPGGHKIDIRWNAGQVKELKITFGYENTIIVTDMRGKSECFSGEQGEVVNIEW